MACDLWNCKPLHPLPFAGSGVLLFLTSQSPLLVLVTLSSLAQNLHSERLEHTARENIWIKEGRTEGTVRGPRAFLMSQPHSVSKSNAQPKLYASVATIIASLIGVQKWNFFSRPQVINLPCGHMNFKAFKFLMDFTWLNVWPTEYFLRKLFMVCYIW